MKGKRVPPFAQSGWIYELKFDGYRLVAGLHDGQVKLATRKGADATRWFPEVVQGLAQIPGGPARPLAVQVCVLDELGRSDFNRRQDRARRRCFYPECDAVTFCAFDLIARDGHSLIGLPVEQRKLQLHQLLTPMPGVILYVGHFDAQHGRVVFEQAVHQLKLEGLVAKRLGSPYRPGERSPDGMKVKRPGAVCRSCLSGRPRWLV
jgi:bifunctional non-homologous end joining protein LigD